MQAKKSLGQNFLSDENTLRRIADEANVGERDTVVEVGPGQGSLTRALLGRARRVIAIEKDHRLIPILNQVFAEEIAGGKLVLVEGDVLETNIADLTQGPYSVVANIPYYITGKFLRHTFASMVLPDRVVLLVQKEVAERITSDKESLLSLSIKTHGVPRYCFGVPREMFDPKPNVDSAVIAIEGVSRDFFSSLDEAMFFSTLKRAFSQKRKTLLNSLFPKNKEEGRVILEKLGLTDTARPEELSKEQWKKLVQSVS